MHDGDESIIRDALEGPGSASLPWKDGWLQVKDLKPVLEAGTAEQKACYARLWATNNNNAFAAVLAAITKPDEPGYMFHHDKKRHAGLHVRGFIQPSQVRAAGGTHKCVIALCPF